MIDWHCHILPGIDDGPKTMAESLEMARLLLAAGFVEVHCTPHYIMGGYDNTPDQVRQATESFQTELRRAGIPLTVKPGMEYYLDEYFPVQLENPLTLGDTRLVLVEASSQAQPELIKQNVYQILRRGFIPLFAHPERCSLLAESLDQKREGLIKKRSKRFFSKLLKSRPVAGSLASDSLRTVLLQMGCLFQGNISSLGGWYGKEVRAQAMHNLGSGFYSYFGSDGHSVRSLKKGLLPGLAVLGEHPEFTALVHKQAKHIPLSDIDYKARSVSQTVLSAS
jgi:protein-tyrosine phosphatase